MPTARPDEHADQPAPPGQGFSVRAALELDRQSLTSRVVFSGVVALVSSLVLPWQLSAGWFTALLVWEAVCAVAINPYVLTLTEKGAIRAFAAFNVVGSSLYSFVALAALANGSPVGVAIGATWLGGAFMNNFIYYGENRTVLWSCMTPAVAAALVGPMLGHGPTMTATLVSGLILTALIAARSFSLDHQELLNRLAERQSALAEVEGKLSLLLEASGDGFFDVDLVTNERKVSDGWAAMLGYERSELSNPDLLSFAHPDDRAMVQAEFERHFKGETPHTASEQRLRCKDGGYKWVLARARLISRAPDGAPKRLIGTTIDISARKALDLQLAAARDAAERANDAKSMFVANMSHEIRTPLNGVIGVAGVLARTELTHEQREMVDLVQSSAQILERLLSDVLDQAKLQAGEFALQVAPFDLVEAVEAAAELMRARAEEKQLGFSVNFTEAARGEFLGDAVRLRQVITNLAANAIKFTERGDVGIEVDAEPPAELGEPALVTVMVADTGIGFDAAAAERLFGRFVQADGSISRRFGGTGLGLAISKALTELMGGQITAWSEPGVGSCFTVTLPLAPVAAEATAGSLAAPEDAPPDDGAGLTGLRVLLAEDHPTNQRVMQLILEPLGVRLMVAEDGEAALRAFAPGAFDLVLMDMQMPRLDGLSATKEIRRRERDAGATAVPIAMLTANAMAEHRQMAIDAGADHHIAKPITPQSLIDGILEALRAERRPLSEAVA